MIQNSALVMIVIALTCGICSAGTNATRFEIRNGKFRLAQSYCQMCRDARITCTLGCNGAGACIQRCEDQFSIASNIIVVAASDIWLGPEALSEAYRAMNKRDE